MSNTSMSKTHFIEPLMQRSTPSIIADKLRLAIGHDEIHAGDQLYEAKLARDLAVSRGPLREAIQQLKQEGLVTAVRNRGVFVIEMTPDQVRDMYLARAAIERAAAEQILSNGDGDMASQILLSVVKSMRKTSAAGEIAATTEADMQFHQSLVELSHSARLSRMHSTLLTETRMCITALEGSYRFGDDRVEEHREIAESLSISATDPAPRGKQRTRVDELLLEHMEDALRRLNRQTS